MGDRPIDRRSAEDWDSNNPLNKADFDFLKKGGEIRFEFPEENMNDFLNRAHKQPPQRAVRGRVVAPQSRAYSTLHLMLAMKAGVIEYGRDAYAILINPVDKMAMQNDYAEAVGQNPVESFANSESQEAFMFEGRILQAALFVEEGKYMVIGEEDYRDLVDGNREHLG